MHGSLVHQIYEVKRLAIHLLSQMPTRPTHADRAQSMELLGSHHLGPLLFVDDVVVSLASDEEVTRAVDAGLGEFATLVNALTWGQLKQPLWHAWMPMHHLDDRTVTCP